MPRTPGTARASDRSPRRPIRVAPWPAGGRCDRFGHPVPGHWAGMAGAWACAAGRTTEAGTSCLNAAPPGFRDPGRVLPTGRSPRGDQRSLPAARRLSPEAQQPVPARWRPRMASLTRTCTETDPAPYPRERLPSYQSGSGMLHQARRSDPLSLKPFPRPGQMHLNLNCGAHKVFSYSRKHSQM